MQHLPLLHLKLSHIRIWCCTWSSEDTGVTGKLSLKLLIWHRHRKRVIISNIWNCLTEEIVLMLLIWYRWTISFSCWSLKWTLQFSAWRFLCIAGYLGCLRAFSPLESPPARTDAWCWWVVGVPAADVLLPWRHWQQQGSDWPILNWVLSCFLKTVQGSKSN